MDEDQRLGMLHGVAGMYAATIVRAIQQEYPNDLRHPMTGSDDRPTPRQVHPAFYGCYDWHSCVEMHWALIRLLRLVPDSLDQDAARSTLTAHLTEQALHQEATYLQSHPDSNDPTGGAGRSCSPMSWMIGNTYRCERALLLCDHLRRP